jgi:ubiquinone/menaquinone biosynthesis C-methylase UbiE
LQLPPSVYHTFVRPKWFTKKYIQNHIQQHFDFANKKVLDFGAGTGANCMLSSPEHYFGIDPDKRRIDFAQRKYPQYRFGAFSGNEIPADDQSFDFILIIAVLHHIPPEQIANYIKEFKRVLKADGKVVAIEPCFFENSLISNWFMKRYDKGEYIRNEDEYVKYFTAADFQCTVLKKFKKCFFYNELYFTAFLS